MFLFGSITKKMPTHHGNTALDYQYNINKLKHKPPYVYNNNLDLSKNQKEGEGRNHSNK